MGWLILGIGLGFVLGSFYPQKDFFVKYINKIRYKVEDLLDK